MNRDTAVTRIQNALAFRTTLASEIVAALQDSQIELEHEPFLPWFLAEEDTSLVTVATVQEVSLPSGFIREYENDALRFIPSDIDEDARILQKDTATFLRLRFSGIGEPRGFAVQRTDMLIFPIPDDVYALGFRFYKQDETLSSGSTENLWLTHAHELMIGIAGLKIAMATRDKAGIEIFSAYEARGRARLLRGSEARENENVSYVMGGED